MEEQDKFRILSIDGGGIRGILPAELLSVMEKEVGEPTHRFFDLVCGTSTGSIIALAIALGQPASEIVNLYEVNAEKIFPKRPNGFLLRNLPFILDLVYGSGAVYNPDALEEVLKSQFLDAKLKDAKTRLCVPSIDISNGKIVVYKTPHSVSRPQQKVLSDDSEKEMWQVARASSAAPVFFPPVKIRDSY